MAHPVHLLDPRVVAIATVLLPLAEQALGVVSVDCPLSETREVVFDRAVRTADAVLAALDAVPPAPRPRGLLTAADVSLFALSVDAGSAALLVRDRASRPSAGLWAVGVPTVILHDEPAQELWVANTAERLRQAGAQP